MSLQLASPDPGGFASTKPRPASSGCSLEASPPCAKLCRQGIHLRDNQSPKPQDYAIVLHRQLCYCEMAELMALLPRWCVLQLTAMPMASSHSRSAENRLQQLPLGFSTLEPWLLAMPLCPSGCRTSRLHWPQAARYMGLPLEGQQPTSASR